MKASDKTPEKLFSRKALLLSSAIAGLFLQPSMSFAGPEYISHWATYNPSSGGTAFDGPTDVAFLKSNGNLLVVKSHAGVTGAGGGVVIIQPDGTYVGAVASVDALGPARTAVNPTSGDVYIGTYYDAKIRHYTESGGTLTLADTWTGCTANGGNGPYTWGKTFGVAIDSAGEFYVADYDNLRIIKMNNSGQCTAAAITGYGAGNATTFLNLTGLAVDSSDNLWVSDYGKKIVAKYNSSGTWQQSITSFSNCGSTTNFNSPKEVDVDPATGNLFVSDGTNGLLKFASDGTFLAQVKKYNTSTTLGTILFGGGYKSGYYWTTDYTHSSVVKYQDPTRKVSVTASANGTVSADSGVITNTSNGNTCTDQYIDGKTVVLTASPSAGYGVTWGGADGSGCTGTTCTLSSIGADKVVTATFALLGPSVSSSAPSGSPAGNATSMNFSVVFSEAVGGVDATDFTLTATGTAAGTIGTPTTSDNITYTVPISGVAGSGTLRLDLKSSGTGITANVGGAAIAAGYTGGTVHNVDTNAPSAPTVATVATGYKKQAATIDFTVTYGEAVTVASNTPRLPVKIGTNGSTTTAYATYVSGSGTTALTFRYTVQAGDTDADGIELASPIDLNGATIKDSGTNDATLTFTVPDVSGIKLDTTVPDKSSGASITTSDADSSTSYTQNDTLTLTFSEPVATANVTIGNLAVNNGHDLGGGASIAPQSASGGYATSYLITLGTAPTLAVGDTLTITAANVVDRSSNQASGNVVFTAPNFNATPTATGVTVSLPGGVASVVGGVQLTGSYTYGDTESDPESGTSFQWYTATAANCTTGQSAIAGATSTTYTALASQEGNYLCFGVTPKSSSGNSPGTEVLGGVQFPNAVPVLSNGSITPSESTATGSVKINEPATLYWLLAPANSAPPVSASEIKTIATGAATSYCGANSAAPGSSGNGFAVGCTTTPDVLARGQASVAAANGTASISLSGLNASTSYILYTAAQDGINNFSLIGNANFTTSAPPAPSSGPSTTTLPTGGGSAAPTGGQTVVVSDNGKNGSTISLPPPTTTTNGTTTNNTVAVQLPNSGGTVNVQSNSSGTQLGVQTTTLPGSTTPVTTVTVNSGSATLTATQSGQPVAGLGNGIVVVSGTSNSRVTVDTTGGAPQIGVTNSDTIIVPQGTPNVAGTVVNLPSPTATGGAATPVTVQTGTQSLSVQATGSGSTISFATTNQGGTTVPVVSVGSGSATITGSGTGSGQPLVAVGGGNTIISAGGGLGGTGNRCNVVTEVTNSSNRDVVQVNTCYIVVGSGGTLRPGGYRDPNAFAEVKDGIVWAGETADFDKNGNVTAVYLGSKEGNSTAVGDDVRGKTNRFSNYVDGTFVPRLTGQAQRLDGADLGTRLFKALNEALGTTTNPSLPMQTSQGILNFTVSGDSNADQKAQSNLHFGLSGDPVSVMPTGRVYVDTARADGVSLGAEGDVEVATGGLIATFAPSVGDPQGFAEALGKVLPGSTFVQRWNGTWQAGNVVGRPAWQRRAQSSKAGFSVQADGNVSYSDGTYSQLIVPDFHDYATLLKAIVNELNDAKATLEPKMDGTVKATVAGKTYTLVPQWQLRDARSVAGKPTWWMEGGVVYIKNADGTAQGFTVR